jgi:hypothetical protein
VDPVQPYIRLLVVAVGLLLLELGAFACSSDRPTGAVSASTIPVSFEASARHSKSAGTCGRAAIEAAVGRFVGAWNRSDIAGLQRLLSTDAIIDMSEKNEREGTTDLTGWKEIEPFAETQWALGQRLSFSSLQVVDSRGAYAHGMRSAYEDGSTQSYQDAKFVYSCEGEVFTHIVLVASARAR